MGVGSGGAGELWPWIFIHGTNIVDRGLIVLFGLFFRWDPWKFLLTPLYVGRGWLFGIGKLRSFEYCDFLNVCCEPNLLQSY